MKIAIFVDETGDVLNPNEKSHFGFGFCYCPFENVEEIEKKIHEAGLSDFHFSDSGGNLLQKLSDIQRISRMGLGDLGLRMGAMIQPDSRYEDFLKTTLGNRIANSPEIFIDQLQTNPKLKRANKKAIVVPQDVLPSVYSDVKLMTYLNLVARFSVHPVLHQFGKEVAEIRMFIGASGELDAYVEKIQGTTIHIPHQALGFFDKASELKQLDFKPGDHLKIEALVTPRPRGIFVLADLAGAVGNHLFRNRANPQYLTGVELYRILEPLFCDFKRETDVNRGVWFFSE